MRTPRSCWSVFGLGAVLAVTAFALETGVSPTPRGSGARPAPFPASTRAERVKGLEAWLRTQASGPGQRPRNAAASRRQQAALESLEASAGTDVRIRFRPQNGTPLQIKGRGLRPPVRGVALADTDRDEQTARAFLRENGPLLLLDQPDEELTLRQRETDGWGGRHLRFEQMYRGRPVWPCELSVHLDAAGNVDLVDGAFVPTPVGIATTAHLAGAQAVERARAAVEAESDAPVSGPDLIVYGPLDRPPRLAWKLEVAAGPARLERCVVDAWDGTILHRVNLVAHAAVTGTGVDGSGASRPLNLWQQGATFYMVDTSKPMFDATSSPPNNARGTIQIYDAGHGRVDDPAFTAGFVRSSSATSGWPADAVGAAFGLSQTYDYYLDRHARNSLDGRGGNVRAIVHYGQNEPNAYWNPGTKTMLYGDGFTRAVDVSGHELTHGVINSVGNGGILEYHDQPGALNEAFADIFGEMVEARLRGGRPDWLKGAELGRAMQNYADPGTIEFVPGRRMPSKMSEFVHPSDPVLDRFVGRDANGVHLNSSIINHAFYLLAEGLEGALGMRDAERIFYRALTLHLQKQSQFIDARHACLAAAEALFGPDSRQVRKTAEAFDRVEIADAPGTPAPSPVPTVQSPDATLALRLDPGSGRYYLVRRETAQGDGAAGQVLDTLKFLAPKRVSVTGDGATAFYVTADSDLGIVETDGRNPRVAGRPGLVHSLAVAPDGQRYAFVLLDAAGEPENAIDLVDLGAQSERVIRLYAPGTEGARLDIIRFADAMDFTADGQTLIYDAYSEIKAEGGQVFGGWTLYALDLRTDTIRTLIDLNEGLDFGNPSLGNVRSHLLTYEVVDKVTGLSTLFAGDLVSGRVALLGTIDPAHSIGVPGYTGDDRAVVYAQGDPTVGSGFSLVRQPLDEDGITPAGPATPWLSDADLGVIYRRGAFVSSNAPPQASMTSPTAGQQFEAGTAVTLQVEAHDPDGRVAKVEFYAGSTRLGEDRSPPYRYTWENASAGAYRLVARAFDDVGASGDSSPVEIRVGAAKPDLTAPTTDVTPDPAEEGQPITLSVTIRNAGGSPAPASRARAYLSPKDDFNADDDVLFAQTVAIPALAAAQEYEATWTAPLPDLGSGTYDFWPLIEVDIDNAVDEADEANLWKRNNPVAARDAATPHPADNHPPDHRITLAEMIAYASAYKRGAAWPVGPNPIPLDYMIRAATLYKRGETYRYDPAAGSAPLWWVNAPR